MLNNAINARKLHQRERHQWCKHLFSALMPASKVKGFGGVCEKDAEDGLLQLHSTSDNLDRDLIMKASSK